MAKWQYRASRAAIERLAKSIANTENEKKMASKIRSLDVTSLRQRFNQLGQLIEEEYGKPSIDELNRAFAEALINPSNLTPDNPKDWLNVTANAADIYEEKVVVAGSLDTIENSDIYFDIINSIASKASNANAKRFKVIKYTYAEEGTGDLNRDEFNELLSADDRFALSRLAKTYQDSKGFTADPLYQEIKNRAVVAGLNKLGSMNIGSVPQEPISASFNFDF